MKFKELRENYTNLLPYSVAQWLSHLKIIGLCLGLRNVIWRHPSSSYSSMKVDQFWVPAHWETKTISIKSFKMEVLMDEMAESVWGNLKEKHPVCINQDPLFQKGPLPKGTLTAKEKGICVFFSFKSERVEDSGWPILRNKNREQKGGRNYARPNKNHNHENPLLSPPLLFYIILSSVCFFWWLTKKLEF